MCSDLGLPYPGTRPRDGRKKRCYRWSQLLRDCSYRSFLFCAFALAACHGNDAGQASDGSASDAVLLFLVPEVPAGCPPRTGNDIGIGSPCTRNGRQCQNGMSCLCDDRLGFAMPASMPCFCTNPAIGTCASTNPRCGTNASCCDFPVTTTTMVSGCFPAICLTNNRCPAITFPDAGT